MAVSRVVAGRVYDRCTQLCSCDIRAIIESERPVVMDIVLSHRKRLSDCLGTARSLRFWADIKSHADGIANSWAAKHGLAVLSIVFLERSSLGRLVHLVFAGSHVIAKVFVKQKVDANDRFRPF